MKEKYKKTIEENMAVLNDCIFCYDTVSTFIKWWNVIVSKYGVIHLDDVKIMLLIDDVKYIDSCFGWTELITTKNFVDMRSKYTIEYKLNLPDCKILE